MLPNFFDMDNMFSKGHGYLVRIGTVVVKGGVRTVEFVFFTPNDCCKLFNGCFAPVLIVAPALQLVSQRAFILFFWPCAQESWWQ